MTARKHEADALDRIAAAMTEDSGPWPRAASHDCGVCDGTLRPAEEAEWWTCSACGSAHTSRDCCEFHEHQWQLREDGYTRSWSTTILDDGTIVATFGGSADWSEDGDGRLYLQCSTCLETRQVPEGTEIDWQ